MSIVALTPFPYSLGRCVKRWTGALTADGNVPPIGSNPATYFYYDGWNLVQEGSSVTSPSRFYVHGARVDEIVKQITMPNKWERYFHYEGRGHCAFQTDIWGNIVEQYEYDAFGQPYFYNASGTNIGSSGWGNRFLFTGREYVSELKLYDFRNRMYQPELGRFLQPDPKHFLAGDYNLYRYCHNDPVNNTDPMGLDTYQQNRELGGDEVRSNYNIVSHSFTFTTNSDNTQVLHTYSWGNTANPKGWNKDQGEDMRAAQKALEAGKGLNKVGDAKLDPHVEKAFNKLNTKEKEHKNLGIARNCKWGAKELLKEARQSQKQEAAADKRKEKPQK